VREGRGGVGGILLRMGRRRIMRKCWSIGQRCMGDKGSGVARCAVGKSTLIGKLSFRILLFVFSRACSFCRVRVRRVSVYMYMIHIHDVYICVYIRVCICMYIHLLYTYIGMHIPIYIYIYIYINMSV